MYLRTWKDARKYREFLLIDDDGNIFDDVRNPEIFSQRIPFPQFEWENDLSLETWILNFVNATHKIHLKWSVLTVKRFGRRDQIQHISTNVQIPSLFDNRRVRESHELWKHLFDLYISCWSMSAYINICSSFHHLSTSWREQVTVSWIFRSSHEKRDQMKNWSKLIITADPNTDLLSRW